jgi:hypothetical protein
MVKKRQREKELIISYENYVDESTSAQVMGEREDEDLFVVDRIGSKTSRRKLKHEEKQQNKTQIISKVERKLIEKRLEKLQQQQESNRNQNESKEEVLVDIWADSVEPVKQKSKKKKVHALKLPIPGVSYNPSHVDHQDAIAEV